MASEFWLIVVVVGTVLLGRITPWVTATGMVGRIIIVDVGVTNGPDTATREVGVGIDELGMTRVGRIDTVLAGVLRDFVGCWAHICRIRKTSLVNHHNIHISQNT